MADRLMTKYVIAALVCVMFALACAVQGAYGGVAVWLSLGVVALGFGSAAKVRGVRLEHEALRRRADAEHEAFLASGTNFVPEQMDPHGMDYWRGILRKDEQ